jgi:hypothetical protein
MTKTSQYTSPKASRIDKFLWWCAGADEQILTKSTFADYVKYSGLGGIVLGTGILAFLGMSFAMYRVFLNEDGSNSGTVLVSALAVGVIWGLLIFNLDRFVVSSTGKGDGKHTISGPELMNAFPRIIMASLIGVTISGPLEIYIFQKEIDKQWQVVKLEKKKMAEASAETIKADDFQFIEKEIEKLEEEKAALLLSVTEFDTKIEYEISQNNGCGRNCREYKAFREQVKTEITLKENLINEQHQKLDNIRAERMQSIELIDKENRGKLGILDSLSALHDYPGSTWPVWLIRILFVLIEVAPVFFKLMIAYSPYDYLTYNTQYKILASNGIAVKNGYSELEKGQIYDKTTYHEAENDIKQRKAKLEADDEIMTEITDKYKKIVKADVEANPGKFIKDDISAENNQSDT